MPICFFCRQRTVTAVAVIAIVFFHTLWGFLPSLINELKSETGEVLGIYHLCHQPCCCFSLFLTINDFLFYIISTLSLQNSMWLMLKYQDGCSMYSNFSLQLSGFLVFSVEAQCCGYCFVFLNCVYSENQLSFKILIFLCNYRKVKRK